MFCLGDLGIGIDSSKLDPSTKIDNFFIMTPGESFADREAARNVANYKSKMFAGTGYIPAGLSGATPTPGEPVNQTSGYGQNLATHIAPATIIAMVQSNWCDWNALKSGGFQHVEIGVIAANSIVLIKKSDGTRRGLACQMVPHGAGVHAENPFDNFKLALNFKKAEVTELISLGWSAESLLVPSMPLGYRMEIDTVYTAGDVIVKVTERCNCVETPVTDMTASDFIITDGFGIDTPAITGVDIASAAQGLYGLTIQKEVVPANLTAGDQVSVKGKHIKNSETFAFSNPELILA